MKILLLQYLWYAGWLTFFMEISYPIGYVLSDKISASNRHCLISRALDHALKHDDLDVHSVTPDGAAFNLGAMQIFGCKLGWIYTVHKLLMENSNLRVSNTIFISSRMLVIILS